MEIDDITIREIPDASIDITVIRTADPQLPSNIGFPVIQMPGCVRARTLKNKQLVSNDERGNLILCDGNVPTLESMAIDWDGLSTVGPIKEDEPEIVPPIPKLKGKERKKVKEKDGKDDQQGDGNIGNQSFDTTNIDSQFIPEPLPCPPPDNKYPIGALGKYGTARVKGFKINTADGKCETIWESLGKLEVLDNYSPPPALVTSTFTVALFGASAALFASPLTKLITKTLKPISKKIIKAVKAKLGKTDKVLSKAERIKAQREKTMINRMWSSLRK